MMDALPVCAHEECRCTAVKFIKRLVPSPPGAYETVWYCQDHFNEIFRAAFFGGVRLERDDGQV